MNMKRGSNNNTPTEIQCFTCQIKSNLLHLTTYPRNSYIQEDSVNKQSQTCGASTEEKLACQIDSTQGNDCPRCKYYVEFISNLMDGIICLELNEVKRKGSGHSCSERAELDSQQKVQVVQKLYVLFSDAQVAALSGRLKKLKPSCRTSKQWNNVETSTSEFTKTPGKPGEENGNSCCNKYSHECPGPKQKQCLLERIAPKRACPRGQCRSFCKETKAVIKRKSSICGTQGALTGSSKSDRRRRSSTTPCSILKKSSKSSDNTNPDFESISDRTQNRPVREVDEKKEKKIENQSFQQSLNESNEIRADVLPKCQKKVLWISNIKNTAIRKSKFKLTIPKSSNSAPVTTVSKKRRVLSPFGGETLTSRQKSQSFNELITESYDELISTGSLPTKQGKRNDGCDIKGTEKNFLFHTSSNGKCTSLVIASSQDEKPTEGNENIRIDFKALKKHIRRK